MEFIRSFTVAAVCISIVYHTIVLLYIDAPIPGEYWVGEMLMIKQEIAAARSRQPKLIVAGGSSVLFGFDSEYAARELRMPAVNLGLHAGFRLDKILTETAAAARSGDTVVLSLEPSFYDCPSRFSTWIVENIIAWDHQTWRELSYFERFRVIAAIRPLTLGRMLRAKFDQAFFPGKLAKRLETFDKELVLSKFRSRVPPDSFEYSAYHLSDSGDLLGTPETGTFTGAGVPWEKPDQVCPQTKALLKDFVMKIKNLGAEVYFANSPYIAGAGDLAALRRGEQTFRSDLAQLGCVLDRREDMILDRRFFFNTKLHLSAQGRRIRTERLLNALNSRSGSACASPGFSK